MSTNIKKLLDRVAYKQFKEVKWRTEMQICRRYDYICMQSIFSSSISRTLNNFKRYLKALNDFRRIESKQWYIDLASNRTKHRPKS